MQTPVCFIEGDGIGPELWAATRPVLDAALEKASSGQRSILWQELLAGEKALAELGEALPEATIATLRNAAWAIKGPLATPVGTGLRSLNGVLRRSLGLYACMRPFRYFEGLTTPVTHPERVDITLFRENTEDMYTGIEFSAGSPESKRLIAFLRDELGVQAALHPEAALGVKPMSEHASKRLIRMALRYALETGKPSVTLMHKGNIMKYTEGAFRHWGYELAEAEFAGQWIRETDAQNEQPCSSTGTVTLKDRMADDMFHQVLSYPENYSVIAAPNQNGDYLSDALAAQIGGLGLAPGVNLSDTLAFYEAAHGTAPGLVNKDVANPSAMMLCGAMMLEAMACPEAAGLIRAAIGKAIAQGHVTHDMGQRMPRAVILGCKAYGDLIGQLL